MLADKPAQATIAVTDMDKARTFYGETLGLEQREAMGNDVALFESGGTAIVIYKSEFAGTIRPPAPRGACVTLLKTL